MFQSQDWDDFRQAAQSGTVYLDFAKALKKISPTWKEDFYAECNDKYHRKLERYLGKMKVYKRWVAGESKAKKEVKEPIHPKQPLNYTRMSDEKAAKSVIKFFLFGALKEDHLIYRAFASLWPTVAEDIKQIKSCYWMANPKTGKKYTNLYFLLTKMESKFLIDDFGDYLINTLKYLSRPGRGARNLPH